MGANVMVHCWLVHNFIGTLGNGICGAVGLLAPGALVGFSWAILVQKTCAQRETRCVSNVGLDCSSPGRAPTLHQGEGHKRCVVCLDQPRALSWFLVATGVFAR